VKFSLILATLTFGMFLVVATVNAAEKAFTTQSGLKVEIIQEGTGPKPKPGQTVSVHYTGTLPSGRKFDSSRDRGEPISFPLGQGRVIRGWDEGIALLNVGTKAKLTIPPDLGYGASGAGGVIPPNATLLFEVELMGAK
jgi:FKBP-type peptidyl-prolyl cis-trans isomerase